MISPDTIEYTIKQIGQAILFVAFVGVIVYVMNELLDRNEY
jgi:hypothetical protein